MCLPQLLMEECCVWSSVHQTWYQCKQNDSTCQTVPFKAGKKLTKDTCHMTLPDKTEAKVTRPYTWRLLTWTACLCCPLQVDWREFQPVQEWGMGMGLKWVNKETMCVLFTVNEAVCDWGTKWHGCWLMATHNSHTTERCLEHSLPTHHHTQRYKTF